MRPVTPERAAAVTGVPAETIRRLAHELGTARRGAVYGRLGVTQSRVRHPGVLARPRLNIATGRLDEIGGVMFATPAFDLPVIGERTTDLIGYDRWRSRVRGIPEFAAEFPVATLADEILDAGGGAGPRPRAVRRKPGALRARRLAARARRSQDLELCVAVDYYVTESRGTPT